MRCSGEFHNLDNQPQFVLPPRGRPGFYLRLFDISRLCPFISFTEPWLNPPGIYSDGSTQQREATNPITIVQVVEVGGVKVDRNERI